MNITKNPKQRQLPFLETSDRAAALRKAVQENPDIAAEVKDRLTLSEEEAEANSARRDDQEVTNFFEGLSQRALSTMPVPLAWSSFWTAFSALTALGTGGMPVMLAAGLGFAGSVMTGGIVMAGGKHGDVLGSNINNNPKYTQELAKNPDSLFHIQEARLAGLERLPHRRALAKEALENPEFLRAIEEDPQMLEPTSPSKHQTYARAKETTPFKKAAGGVINTLRNLPKLATLPLVNAVREPENIREEVQNENVARWATPALVTGAIIASVASGVGPALAFGATVGALVSLTTQGYSKGLLNVGRETVREVQESGKDTFLNRIKTGHKKAFQTSYSQGEYLASHTIMDTSARYGLGGGDPDWYVGMNDWSTPPRGENRADQNEVVESLGH